MELQRFLWSEYHAALVLDALSVDCSNLDSSFGTVVWELRLSSLIEISELGRGDSLFCLKCS